VNALDQCPIASSDAGVDESLVRRVIVGVSGSIAKYAALHAAAALARRCDAELVAVHAARRADDGETQILDKVFVDGFGVSPAELGATVRYLQGNPRRALVSSATEPGDVLVVGSGRRRRLSRRRDVSRYCEAHAPCMVVTVPPPPALIAAITT